MHRNRLIILSIFLMTAFAALTAPAAAQDKLTPDRTVKFASRDTCELYMDIYEPHVASAAQEAPTMIFVFGGGFISGERNHPSYGPWFDKLTAEGWRVVSIDYRLALKGRRLRIPKDRGVFLMAVDTAVEDLYSATKYLIDNASSLNIDTDKIAIMGSSAGALTVLSADWYLSNRAPLAQVLPEDFRYKGVVSLSGAVISDKGIPAYTRGAAPTLLLHGTVDRIVPYKGYSIFNWALAGSDRLAKVFAKNGANYNIIRFKDHTHDIASAFVESWAYIKNFLARNVLGDEKIIIDALVDDPTFEPFTDFKAGDLYD